MLNIGFFILIYLIFYNYSYCGCNCCKSCKTNNNNSYKKYDNQNIDTQIYDVLKTSSELKGKDLKKIGDRYLEILDNCSDDVKSLDKVTDVPISRDIILAYLNVNECLEKMHGKADVKEKVAIIIDTILNDLNNKVFKFKDANLKCPRCLIIHENNNCHLITYLIRKLCDPYFLKFFYLFNTLFSEGLLNKNQYPLMFEFCNFFNNAISNPQFSDKIRCNKITDVFFDVYKDNPYAKTRSKDSFQSPEFFIAIKDTIEDEIKDLNNTKILSLYLLNNRKNSCAISYQNDTYEKYLFLETDILPKNNFFKDPRGGDVHIINVLSCGYHIYTIRIINNVFISYDSFAVKEPTPVSQYFVAKIFLNSHLQIKNFNSTYDDKIVSLVESFTYR